MSKTQKKTTITFEVLFTIIKWKMPMLTLTASHFIFQFFELGRDILNLNYLVAWLKPRIWGWTRIFLL